MDSSGETNANIRSMCEDPDFATDVLNCVTGVCTAQEIQGKSDGYWLHLR